MTQKHMKKPGKPGGGPAFHKDPFDPKPNSGKPDSEWMGNDQSEAGIRRQQWNEKMNSGDARYVPKDEDHGDKDKNPG